QHLPLVSVEEMPDELKKEKLPHLSAGRYCCLFDEETIILDPLNPKSVVAAWVVQVEKIIDLWVSKDLQSEFAAEFSSYWQSEISCFFISSKIDNVLCGYSRIGVDKKKKTEFVVADSRENADEWREKRIGSSLDSEIPSVVVDLRCGPYVPFGNSWPLKSFSDVIQWLSRIEPPAVDSLIAKIGNRTEKAMVSVVLRYETELVGFVVTLHASCREALKRYLGKNNKHVKRKGNRKVGKTSRSQMLKLLSSKQSEESFWRMDVKLCTESYILERNIINNQPPLARKKIALIGCGTIGGYTAQSLVQLGAGSLNGSLTLFDKDNIQPGNLGRHLLGINYLGENKSAAMVHWLKSTGLANKILHQHSFKYEDVSANWDVIIDATGSHSFSLLLAKWIHGYRVNKRDKPLLIHGWISGFGHITRALRDDGRLGCYACQFDYSHKPKRERHESFTKGNSPDYLAFKRSCGASHLPFSSNASMSSAAMITQLLQQENKTSPNFLQRRITQSAKEVKDVKLSRQKGCPVCLN
ncbi:ThiF family adenylyltransferase, partial [Pseudoalteromonas sp. '520P1 No. 412']